MFFRFLYVQTQISHTLKRSLTIMKKWIGITLFLLFLLLISYSTITNKTKESVKNSTKLSDKTSEEILIGATFLGSFEFPQKIKKIMEIEAGRKKINLLTYVEDKHSSQQVEHIEEMISKNVDVIVLNSPNIDSTEGIELAAKNDIPVVVVNTIVNSNKMASYIGSNDIEAGEISMQYIAEKLNKTGNIVILSGKAGQSSQIQREQGILNALKNYPNINVLESVSGEWSLEKSHNVMEQLYRKYGSTINAIVAQNDEMALGASKFLREHNVRQDVLIIGTDGIKDALVAIKNGELDATVFQDADGQAKLTLEVATVLANHGQIARSYFLPYKLVTKENVDYYLKKMID